MKISELGQPDKQLITKLPVDNDQYTCAEPGNRLDPEATDHSPDQEAITRLRQLAGLTLGTGSKKDHAESPLTHGGTERGAYMKKHNIEPGTEEWFKLWFARPKLTGENPYGPS
jgi:hypothetical protein